MTNNNWELKEEEKLLSLEWKQGYNYAMQKGKDLLTKKDQEHKAELEKIKGEIKDIHGFSICSAHQTGDKNCKLCDNAPISKEEALSIIDRHINSLTTQH